MILVRQIDPQLRLSNLKELIDLLPATAGIRQMGRWPTQGGTAGMKLLSGGSPLLALKGLPL
jgi:hypothetical protein